MNQKEINELKRRFRADRTNVSHIYGCYVNTKGEIISRVDTALSMVPQEETELYLDRLKKVLSGAQGRNLIDIIFTPEQVSDSDEHRLLMALRDSRLQDPEIREEFYQKVAESLTLEDQNYLLLLACDSYDVPRRGRDGRDRSDESEQVFTYVVCAVCPVKEGGAALKYFHEESAFHISGAGQLVNPTVLGFLFPAFDNRTTNISNALYYAKQPAELHQELIDALFRTDEPPMSAAAQQEAFNAALTDGLEQECSFDVVQAVHEILRERIMEHKEERDPEPLALSAREITEVLEKSGVSREHQASFRGVCEAQFGDKATLNPSNLIDSGKFEIVTPEAKISVNPEFSYLVEARVINGRKYLLIPADQSVEVNGLPVHIAGPESDEPGADAESGGNAAPEADAEHGGAAPEADAERGGGAAPWMDAESDGGAVPEAEK